MTTPDTRAAELRNRRDAALRRCAEVRRALEDGDADRAYALAGEAAALVDMATTTALRIAGLPLEEQEALL